MRCTKHKLTQYIQVMINYNLSRGTGNGIVLEGEKTVGGRSQLDTNRQENGKDCVHTAGPTIAIVVEAVCEGITASLLTTSIHLQRHP